MSVPPPSGHALPRFPYVADRPAGCVHVYRIPGDAPASIAAPSGAMLRATEPGLPLRAGLARYDGPSRSGDLIPRFDGCVHQPGGVHPTGEHPDGAHPIAAPSGARFVAAAAAAECLPVAQAAVFPAAARAAVLDAAAQAAGPPTSAVSSLCAAEQGRSTASLPADAPARLLSGPAPAGTATGAGQGARPRAGADAAAAPLALGPAAALLLRLCATHEGRAEAEIAARAVALYAEMRVGLPALAEARRAGAAAVSEPVVPDATVPEPVAGSRVRAPP